MLRSVVLTLRVKQEIIGQCGYKYVEPNGSMTLGLDAN